MPPTLCLTALHFPISTAQYSPPVNKPAMAARRSFAPNTQLHSPVHETMLYDSPYTAIYYNKQSQRAVAASASRWAKSDRSSATRRRATASMPSLPRGLRHSAAVHALARCLVLVSRQRRARPLMRTTKFRRSISNTTVKQNGSSRVHAQRAYAGLTHRLGLG